MRRVEEIRRAIAAFASVSAAPVAPHIAIRLARYARHEPKALAQLARELTPGQLSGRSQLPEPLPQVPASEVMMALAALTSSQHRLLLAAALAATDSVAVVLDAAAVSVDTLLSHEMPRLVRIHDGCFRFEDDRLRVALVRAEEPASVRRVHAALARSARRTGQTSLAAWHGALAAEFLERAKARALIQVAERQLELGAVGPAQRIAGWAVVHTSGETRLAAARVGARAALWAGHLDDALDLAASATATGVDEHVEATVRVARMLLDGAIEDEEPRRRVIAHYVPLQGIVAGADDARAMGTLVEMAHLWWTDPDGTDALQAGLTLTTRRAHGASPRLRDQSAPSPLAEAHVRLMQSAFQLQAGDKEGARSTLAEAMPRLPLVVPGAGIVTSLVGMALQPSTGFDGALMDAYRAVSPPSTILYDLYGPDTGQRTTVASRRARPDAAVMPASSSRLVEDAALTPREHDVVGLLVEGLSNGVIGHRLGISARTVEVHLSRVYQKLGVRSRSGLIALLLREDSSRTAAPPSGSSSGR